MKKFFKSCSARVRVALCMMVAACGVLVSSGMNAAYAQAQDIGHEILNETQSTMTDLIMDIIGVVQTLLAIAAIVSLFVVVYNIWKQERDAAQKAIWWVVGLAAGWAALYAIGSLVGGGA